MCVRPDYGLADLLKQPKPKAMLRAQRGLRQMREQAAQADIDHVNAMIMVRDRLSGLRKIITQADGRPAMSEINDIIDGIDGWLRLHRGQG